MANLHATFPANTAALWPSIADEVVNVAQTRDLEFDCTAMHHQIDVALAEHQAHKLSMLQNIEAGRLRL